MNRNWQIIEKIIAGVLILCGCFLFFDGIYTVYDEVNILLQHNVLKWEQVSFLKTFQTYHLFVLPPLAAIIGGIFLLINRKIGWILSLIASLLYTCVYFIPFDKLAESEQNYKSSKFILLISCMAIFFLVIAITLALKPFRDKYKANKKNWLIISAIVFLILTDKFLAYVFSLSVIELLQHK